MAGYEVYFRESVWKDLKRIPKKDLQNILAQVCQIERRIRAGRGVWGFYGHYSFCSM